MEWYEKILIEKLHNIVKALKKIDNEPGDCIFGVCKEYIRKLSDYCFTILDEETTSLVNETLFTGIKENATLIKHFGTMYINFGEYPPYIGAISEFLKLISMLIFSVVVDYPIQQSKATYWHELTRKVGEWWKNISNAKQVNKCPTRTLWKICTYIQNETVQNNYSFYLPPDSENTFST